jgi:predicted alpha/beta superfamily hydrolase
MRTLLVILVLSLFGVTAADAQGQSAIEMGEQHVLRSRVMNENREILVTLPESYARTTIGYPVLFVLDGSSHILDATATTRTLAAARNRAPELIVVAVPNTSGNRSRDLTPGAGAERFERFFGEELIPWVDKRYRTVPERIIMGHDFSLFARRAVARHSWLVRLSAVPELLVEARGHTIHRVIGST